MRSIPKISAYTVSITLLLSSSCFAVLWPSSSRAQRTSEPTDNFISASPISLTTPADSTNFDPAGPRRQQQRSGPSQLQSVPAPSTAAEDLQARSTQSSKSSTVGIDYSLSPALIADEGQGDSTGDGKLKRRRPFGVYFGARLNDPTSLRGPTRLPVVFAAENIEGGPSLSGGVQLNLSPSEKLFLEFRGGESVLGEDLSFFTGSDDLRRGFAFNIFDQRSFSPSFVKGTDVNLPNGRTPWVNRFGGGVEVRRPLGNHIGSSAGITYQNITIRDRIFGSSRQPVDQFGNPLSVSPSGRDDLLTLNLVLRYDTRDDAERPTHGTHIKVGLDQSLPIGSAAITMTRLNASASQFVPLPFLFKKRSTLVFNVQGGRIFGDVPPYEAFNLGGDTTVRGYSTGEIGTGSSFFEASVEYRFPLFDLRLAGQPIGVGGQVFVDYGSLLGTQTDVIGQPGAVRNKPGDGLGYGAGLSVDTRFGLARVDAGINDQGGVRAHFSLDERF